MGIKFLESKKKLKFFLNKINLLIYVMSLDKKKKKKKKKKKNYLIYIYIYHIC